MSSGIAQDLAIENPSRFKQSLFTFSASSSIMGTKLNFCKAKPNCTQRQATTSKLAMVTKPGV